MNTRLHHPSCPSRNGGLCQNCPPNARTYTPVPAAVHLSCRSCREQYVALGVTPEAVDRAANSGPTCCLPKSVSATATNRVGETVTGAEVAGGAFTSPPAADHILVPLSPASTVRLVALLVLVFGGCAGFGVLLAMEIAAT